MPPAIWAVSRVFWAISASSRSEFASPLSSLKGQISQHTNPVGMISDNAIQKVFLNSLSDGVMREMVKMSIVRIGNKADPDYAFVEAWLKAIGSKGRKLVDMAYMAENLASDEEGEAFLATKVPQYG